MIKKERVYAQGFSLKERSDWYEGPSTFNLAAKKKKRGIGTKDLKHFPKDEKGAEGSMIFIRRA